MNSEVRAQPKINQQAKSAATYWSGKSHQQRGISLVPAMLTIMIFTLLTLHITMPQQQRQEQTTNVAAARLTALQLLQGALAYRAGTEGTWPSEPSDLGGYLPSMSKENNPTNPTNPWGQIWEFSCAPLPDCPTLSTFILKTDTTTNANARSLARHFGGLVVNKNDIVNNATSVVEINITTGP